MKAEAGISCVFPVVPLSLNKKRFFTFEKFDHGGDHEKEICSTYHITAGPGNLRSCPSSYLTYVWDTERCCG